MKFEWDTKCYLCRPRPCQKEENIAKQDYWTNGVRIIYEEGGVVRDDEFDCQPAFGYTNGARDIEFASMSNFPNLEIRALRNRNNVVHELGHAFNRRLGGAPERAVNEHPEFLTRTNPQDPNDPLGGFYMQPGAGSVTWSQSTQLLPTEIFADQFLGWVYGTWANSNLGRARAQFMAQNMPQWIRDTCNNR